MDPQREFELSRGMSDSLEGTVVAVDWTSMLATVSAGLVTTRMPWSGPAPWVGDRVRVIKAGLKPVCALIAGSPMGTAVSVSAGLVTVTGDDGRQYKWPHLGAAPASGGRVRLDHAGRVVVGAYSSEPPGSTWKPPTPPPTAGGAAWFHPIWSGSWRYGALSGDDVEVSYSRVAGYGHGTQVRDTVPAGATLVRADLHLVPLWDRLPGSVASMGVHSHNARPGTLAEGDISGTVGVPSNAAVSILGPLADALRAGTAFGVAFRPGDGSWWRSYAAAPTSGRLYLEWS